MALVLDGTTGVPVTTVTGTLPVANGGTGGASNFTGFKNRIINGAMVIDQRNAGASVTQTTADLYPVDRFRIVGSVTSKFTGQQSTTAPAGFINSLLLTSSATTSLAAGDYYICTQKIEGFNIANLAWGTASAATVTLSFWTRSSLTGTFGGALLNSAANRSYPFTYTISVANTWEQKTITIAGDTSGTWLTTNGTGMFINFGLGVGTTYSGTANAWAGAFYFSATGATSVVGTNGATFYLTGVQLEVGSTATSFEYRPYGTELALCQRYYQAGLVRYGGYCTAAINLELYSTLPVPMRTTPTVVSSSPVNSGSTSNAISSSTAERVVLSGGGTGGPGFACGANYTASAEL